MKATVYTMTVWGNQDPYTRVWLNEGKACQKALCEVLRPINPQAADALERGRVDSQEWRQDWEDAWVDVITNMKVEYDWKKFELPVPTVIVTVEGGLVQSVMATKPCHVLVVDFDTEGTQDEVVRMPDGNDALLNWHELRGSLEAENFLETLPKHAD